MFGRKLTKAEREAVERAKTLPDDRIDLTDPDAPEHLDWSQARRGAFYRPVKQQLTLRIDADVLDWFRRHPRGRGYQSHINAALRAYVAKQESTEG